MNRPGVKATSFSIPDEERFRLRHGPYMPPLCSIGDELRCALSGELKEVKDWTIAPIPWPAAATPGKVNKPVVCGALVDALRTESIQSVAYHWGVGVGAVCRWRQRLNLTGTLPIGTRAAQSAIAKIRYTLPDHSTHLKRIQEESKRPEALAKMRESRRGQRLTPDHKKKISVRSAQTWASNRPRMMARRTIPEEARKLLGAVPDSLIAEQTGRTVKRIAEIRRGLCILRRKPIRPFTREEVLLITVGNLDVAALTVLLGRSRTSIAGKLRALASSVMPYPQRLSGGESKPNRPHTEDHMHSLRGRYRVMLEDRTLALVSTELLNVSPQHLSNALSRWHRWWAFGLWVRLIVESHGVTDEVREVLNARCRGFSWSDESRLTKGEQGADLWLRLFEWIQKTQFSDSAGLGWEHALLFCGLRSPEARNVVRLWRESLRNTGGTTESLPPLVEWVNTALVQNRGK